MPKYRRFSIFSNMCPLVWIIILSLHKICVFLSWNLKLHKITFRTDCKCYFKSCLIWVMIVQKMNPVCAGEWSWEQVPTPHKHILWKVREMEDGGRKQSWLFLAAKSLPLSLGKYSPSIERKKGRLAEAFSRKKVLRIESYLAKTCDFSSLTCPW